MRRSAGFTLFEVLVAGAIAAAMMAALLGVLRDGSLTLRSASDSEIALAVARNHLALAEADISHAAPSMRGVDGDYSWQTTVTRGPLASPGGGIVAAYLARNSVRPALFAVEVVVRWQSGGKTREIRLATDRLGYAEPSGELQ